MPIFGSLDVKTRSKSAPSIKKLADKTWETKDSEVLYLTFEFDTDRAFECLPPALHPSIPPFGGLMFRRHHDSPAGPYTLAELRMTARAGIHYAGYCFGAYCSSKKATKWLRETYGWPAQHADVRIERLYHGIAGIVEIDGVEIANVMLETPHYISGKDVLYTPNLNLCKVKNKLRLAQVEYDFEFIRCERGEPRVEVFDPEAFGEGRIEFTEPLPATYSLANMKYHEIRYLVDPSKPAMFATEDRDGKPVKQV